MYTVIKPPQSLPDPKDFGSIMFLAGSIEMGTAENWQDKLTNAIISVKNPDHKICILNPRRDAWDNSWEQSINNPEFKAQVEWELKGLEIATHIFFYFDPNTKSPISLMELGLYAKSDKAMVVCPESFYRKGNVDILCERYLIPNMPTLQEAIDLMLNTAKEHDSNEEY